MANTISATTAAANIPQIWANKALVALSNNVVLPGIVSRTWDSEFKQKGNTVNILNSLTIAANAKAVQTEITLQTPTFSNVQVVLNKHYESSVATEDVAKTLMIDDKMQAFTDAAMKSLANQIDADLIAEAANFTGTAVGTQGTAIDPAGLRLANKRLIDAKSPTGNVLVIGSQSQSDLLGQSLFVQANTVGSPSAVQNAKLTSLFGFDIYVDQNISRTGSPAGDKNLAFNPDALALASAPLYSPSNEFSGAVMSAVASDPQTKMGIRFTASWSHKDLATIMTYDVLYGVKVVRPTLGLYVYGA
jgi:hypothetical protein